LEGTINVLTGFKKVKDKDVKESDIVVPDGCDLNIDSQYKYDMGKKTFIPLGHGFAKPKYLRKELKAEYVLFKLVDALVNGEEIPYDCIEWRDWYKENMQKRIEETLKKGGRK